MSTPRKSSKKDTVVNTVLDTPMQDTPVAAPARARTPDEIMIMQDQKRRSLVEIYSKEKKFPITISPFYAPYLGNVVMISLQGIPMYVPANGQTYLLPESYAAEGIQAMAQVDSRQRKQNRLSDVRQNLESSIGAIKF